MLRTLIATSIGAAASLTCLDESGQAVDWFAVFKFHGGLDYAYIDANSAVKAIPLQLTGKSLNDASTAVGSTFGQLYGAGAESLAIIAYNDEKPAAMFNDSDSDALQLSVTARSVLRGLASRLEASFESSKQPGHAHTPLESGTSGHTKGVLAADANGGYWMVHSVPKYPDLSTDSYSWTTSTTYGQTFLCMSLDSTMIEAAAGQIAYNDPLIFTSQLPSDLAALYPTMESLINGNRAEGTSVQTLTTTPNGHQFVSFAKSGSWDQDLYEDLVQPKLNINMLWETWRRSPQMQTYCRSDGYSYDSINVETLAFLDANGNEAAFKYTQDHSKFGIAANATSAQDHWACIGDINRMTSQWARGGGTVCFRATQVYQRVVASITTADQCSSNASST